jgi:Ca2+-binding RTX toxin-like protein
VGGTGNDTYIVDRMNGLRLEEAAGEGIDAVLASGSHLLGDNIELLFIGGTSAAMGIGNGLANLLRGNAAANVLIGGGGADILEGRGGNDVLWGGSGNTLLSGGTGTDWLIGGSGNDLLIGGSGNDTLITGAGADIIAFNKGDGADTVAASTGTDNTLSLGGGATYADLVFQKSGSDLILKVGASDRITFTGYYASPTNRSVNTLQIVIEGTSDYDAGSGNAMNNKKIETFDFGGLVAAFDAARAANPGLTSWALTSALASQYLSGSDVAALGGDLAYRYNRFGTLADISFTPAQGILGAAGFGSSVQALQAWASLQDNTVRLS